MEGRGWEKGRARELGMVPKIKKILCFCFKTKEKKKQNIFVFCSTGFFVCLFGGFVFCYFFFLTSKSTRLRGQPSLHTVK